MDYSDKPFKEKHKTLYVSDLDGTLLGTDSRISGESARILTEAIDRGAWFTVATARTPATVEPLLGRIPLCVPAIVMTGAALWDHRGQHYILPHLIPKSDSESVSHIMAKYGLRPFVYTLGSTEFLNVYHPIALSKQEEAFYVDRRKLALKRFHIGQFPASLNSVVLFFAVGTHQSTAAAAAEIAASTKCAYSCYPDIFNPSTGFLEVFAAGVSKAAAVSELRSSLGAERVVVFGDNLNDLPMMEVADVAVAVENAFPEVKEKAHQVIGPNSADSVARYILEDLGRNL